MFVCVHPRVGGLLLTGGEKSLRIGLALLRLIWEYGLADMGTHMKTTIDLSDALLEAAKRHARAQGTTLRAIVEEGLRVVLGRDSAAASFQLRDASVGGNGIRPEVREGGWERIAELVYEGHGG